MYTITVTNVGDATAENLVIEDTPDKNLKITDSLKGIAFENCRTTLKNSI